jgi:pimeloyl-ACP methyl ester carboxylesterase
VDELRAGLPSLAIDWVTGSGHYIYEEQPDAVVAAVKASAPALQAMMAR